MTNGRGLPRSPPIKSGVARNDKKSVFFSAPAKMRDRNDDKSVFQRSPPQIAGRDNLLNFIIFTMSPRIN